MTKSLKKMGLLGLVIMLFGLIVSCGAKNSGESKTAGKGGKELVVGVTSFADTLEPTEQYFSWVITRYGVGENLTRFDENGELKPYLAESWAISDDNLTWTFKIREGVKFSNGNPLTAEAVKSSIERVFEKTKRADGFFKYKSITADGQNLVITTEKPIATLPQSLADPLFLIIDTTAVTEDIITKGPISTGPYKFVEFVPGQQTVVERNEHYWNGTPKLDRVIYKDINDQNTRALALKSGEIQVAYNLKIGNRADFEGMSNIAEQSLKSLRTTYAFMNQKGLLKDLVLRQAIIRALDRETYTQNLLKGAATAGKAPIPPTLDYGFNELKDQNAYNPESAKQILAAAGYKDIDGDGFVETPDGKKLDLNFVIYTSREELGVYAQAAQVSLKEVGIKVTLKTVAYEALLDLRDTANFDMLIWNVLVANTGDPEYYFYENWHSESVSNQAGYNNPKVDELLDKMSTEFDMNKRRELAIQIEQILMDDAATVFFGYETTFLFSDKKVKGLKMYPMDYYWITSEVEIAE